MQIECDIEGIDPQPVLMAFFERVLRNAANRVAVDPDAIGRVLIVSPERFGAAVESIHAGAAHTNTAAFVAGGKTIPRRDGNRVISDVILQCSLLDALVEVLSDPPTTSQWGIDQEQAFYVICHELGHALDYTLRDDASNVTDPRSHPFSIHETANYYGNIALTEYAASRNSAVAMTDAFFNHERQEAAYRMSECDRQVKHYLANPQELTPRALAHFVCQAVWLTMVELSKLYGHAAGRMERETTVRQLESELLEGTPLGDALSQFGSTYPKWDVSSHTLELTGVWHKYGAIYNVRFSAGEGDSDEMENLV